MVGADLKHWVFHDHTKELARKKMLRKMKPGKDADMTEMLDLVGY
jgi:hypothetical protein